jgi:twitching motility protein PilT
MNLVDKNFNFQKTRRMTSSTEKIRFEEILEIAVRENASDIHIQATLPPIIRSNKRLIAVNTDPLTPEDITELIEQITSPKQMAEFKENLDLDYSFGLKNIARFRVNLFSEKDSYGAALRKIPFDIPPVEKLGLPNSVINFSTLNRGFVLVTGPTGHGKSTTLAALIDKINRERDCHIITIEDPIEYLFVNKKSIIIQREVGANTKSFSTALRASLREDPDIILIGEMRDYETIAAALTAAETGHLVFATLHTNSAAQSIDRIIDVFPPHQQQQIKSQLANVISGIVTQQLLERSDASGVVLAAEVLVSTSAIRNLIREGKSYQIQSVLQTNSELGMTTMDESIKTLFESGKISRETALSHAFDEIELKKAID